MAYQLMASLYDRFMEEAPYDKWVLLTEQIIKKYNLDTPKIIDLGCGTGEISTQLANKYEITGVDYSSDMLTIAEQKASSRQQRITWIHQDLRDLEGLYGYDIAVSYCDVINYITEISDLEKVFRNVANTLRNDGIFIFDVHSLEHVNEELAGHTFSDVTDDSAYIWFCYPGENSGEMYHELTFFALNGDKYDRFDETHHQRTYPIEIYEKLLNHAGFQILNISADFQLENEFSEENAERIFIIAQKGRE